MAAASPRLAAPRLARMLDTCTLAVLGAMNSAAAISRLLRPATSRRSTAVSRLVSPARASAGRPPRPPPAPPGRGHPPAPPIGPLPRLGQPLREPPAGPRRLVAVRRGELVHHGLPG